MTEAAGVRIGVTLPQYELEPGREPVERFVRATEDAGFEHLVAYDHVLGVDVASHPKFRGPYNLTHQFHEPLVLLGFIAALVKLELVTSVIVLAQRNAVLVAKQAAELDVLTGGRLRLGVGIGWNRRELLALGQEWEGRGARFEEQIELMRLLWTNDAVQYKGRFHEVEGLGMSPLPVQRPIPVWIGSGIGASDITYRRIGRLADGWMPYLTIGQNRDEIATGVRAVRQATADSGREEDAVQIDGLVQVPRDLEAANVREQISAWQDLGARRITLRTLDNGLSSAEHIEAVGVLARDLGVQGGRLPVGTGSA